MYCQLHLYQVKRCACLIYYSFLLEYLDLVHNVSVNSRQPPLRNPIIGVVILHKQSTSLNSVALITSNQHHLHYAQLYSAVFCAMFDSCLRALGR